MKTRTRRERGALWALWRSVLDQPTPHRLATECCRRRFSQTSTIGTAPQACAFLGALVVSISTVSGGAPPDAAERSLALRSAGERSSAERTSTSAADRATIERIVAQWRTRAEKIGTLHCVASGTATAAKGCYNGCKYLPEGVEGDVPAEDHSYTLSYDWLFDFKHARFRIAKRGQSFHSQKLIYVPDVKLSACDGVRKPRMLARREWQTTEQYSPPEKQPEFYVERRGAVLNTPDLIGLLVHGAVPAYSARVVPSAINGFLCAPPDFILYGRAERNGCKCVVLRSLGAPPTCFYEYWVDEQRQCAILHWDCRSAGRHIFEFDIAYQEVSGLWLPKTIFYTTFRPQRENPPELSCRMDVTRLEANLTVSDDLFLLEPDDGMTVRNETTGESYRAGDDATVLSQAAWRFVFLLAMIAAISVALWLRRRVFRRAHRRVISRVS